MKFGIWKMGRADSCVFCGQLAAATIQSHYAPITHPRLGRYNVSFYSPGRQHRVGHDSFGIIDPQGWQFTQPITAFVMLYRFFTFSFLLISILNSQAQNMVPNPSFEEYTECPNIGAQVYLAYPWKIWRNTPDYYNDCTEDAAIDIPLNGFGFQYPATGNAYVGLCTYGPGIGSENFREVIGAPLLYAMEIGVTYFVWMKVNLALEGPLYSDGFANNKLGLLFTTQDFWEEENPAPLTNFAQVYSSEIITDTLGWTTISGSFVADMEYSFLGIGNFFEDFMTDTLHLSSDPQEVQAYYYIDDVCVSTNPDCNLFTETSSEILEIGLFPNPANSKLAVRSNCKLDYIAILDARGQMLWDIEVSASEFSVDTSGLSDGMYVVVLYSGSLTKRERLIVNHNESH